MTLSISVVICAYTDERWSQIVSAVDSVLVQGTPADEVILVVDHNEELLRKAMRSFPSITVMPNSGPTGLSGARNTGAAISTGDVVMFLDDDAVAEPDWTEQLLAGYRDENVLGVGGSAAPVWQTSAPRWWPDEFLWVVGCSYRGQPTATAPVRNLMGCNMSFRRDVLRQTGGFDEGLGRTADSPLGCEETELCIRAKLMFPEGRLVYEPKARVHHSVPAGRASWFYYRARCRAEGLSKARVASRVGQAAALGAESHYTRKVLPAAVGRGLLQVLSGDISGLGRAGAVVAGLWITSSSFLVGRITASMGQRKP